MNYFSTNLDINDRRIYTLELSESGNNLHQSEEIAFVIDLQNQASIKLLSLNAEDSFKSFVINESDTNINRCALSATMESQDTLVITINADQIESNLSDYEKKFQQDETVNPIQDDDNIDISFDDLDSFLDDNDGKTEYGTKPKNKKQEEAKKIITPERYEVFELGQFNEYVQVKGIMNNAGFRLEAILTSSIPESPSNNDRLKVKFIFIKHNKQYKNEIVVCLSHPSEYLGVALDFGSESSQMALNRYEFHSISGQQNIVTEPLFKNIFYFHKFKNWINTERDNEYYQEEEGTNFYKSLFFLKKNLEGDFSDMYSKYFIDRQPENLKMLVEKNDGFKQLGRNFLQLPNLKILHDNDEILDTYYFTANNDDGYFPLDLHLKELKQQVYNSILETIIESMLIKEFSKYRSAHRNIKMMMLIPNNYDASNIKLIQSYLHKIFDKIKSGTEIGHKIKTVEILTISESDASFIGFMSKEGVQIMKGKDYIIIDSGKGTTDFSIVRTGINNAQNLSSIYRNGFTGAGNLITYAIFETVIHYIRSVSPDDGMDLSFVENQILKSLKDNDLESRNTFFNALEKLKFNYRDISEKNALLNNWRQVAADTTGGATRLQNIATSGATIKDLSAILDKLGGITDFYGYIDEACNFIADNVLNYLKLAKNHKQDLSLSGAVLTGRAFKFKPLAQLLTKKLESELGVKHITLLEGNELKNICIRGVFNRDIKINSENPGFPIQIIYKTHADIPAEEKHESPAKKKKGFFNSAIGWFFNDLAELENISKIVTVKEDTKIQNLQKSEFLIGCKRYNVRKDDLLNNNFSNGDQSTTIDFTHDGYKVRRFVGEKLMAVNTLTQKNKNSSANPALITPSLFPNYLDKEYIQSLKLNIDKIKSGNTILKDSTSDNDLFFGSTKPTSGSDLFF